MKHDFTIHRASWSPRDTDVTIPSGETVKATVQSLEIELVPDNHDGGSVTFRLLGSEAEEAAAQFKAGDTVTLEVTKIGDAPATTEIHADDHSEQVA